MDQREANRDFWRLLVAFVLPPAGVYMQVGLSPVFWLNVLFTLLGFWVGGQVHAAWVITTTDADGGDQEGGMQRFVSILVSAYLPPVGVFLSRGLSGAFFLNLLLSLCFVVPGTIHAFWLITHAEDG